MDLSLGVLDCIGVSTALDLSDFLTVGDAPDDDDASLGDAEPAAADLDDDPDADDTLGLLASIESSCGLGILIALALRTVCGSDFRARVLLLDPLPLPLLISL